MKVLRSVRPRGVYEASKMKSDLFAKNRSFDQRRGGFTLIELLVRIAIIGALVGLLPKISNNMESDARRDVPNDLEGLCPAVRDYIAKRALGDPIPRDLASIVEHLPEGFEPIEESGGPIDVKAHGYRYHLVHPWRYSRYAREIRFAICATPLSPDLDLAFCIAYDPGTGQCKVVREYEYINQNQLYRQQRDFFRVMSLLIQSEAMGEGVLPEEFAGLLHQVDAPFAKQTLDFLAGGYNEISLKELKDLEKDPIVGGYMTIVNDLKGYGEFDEKLSVPLDSIQVAAKPAAFLSEYHALSAKLEQEKPSPELQSIIATVDSAQEAADKGDLSREFQQMELIREKAFHAWDQKRLSAEAFAVLNYSLKVREAYLHPEEEEIPL